MKGRRPVVAIADTGCASHPWLDRAVTMNPLVDGGQLGDTDPSTDPEVHPSQARPLVGGRDRYAGHGTFMAGLVHQACPDADILTWRCVPAEGAILESRMFEVLEGMATLVEKYRDGLPGGRPIDVVVLALGYYHESPDDVAFDAVIAAPLRRLAACGTVVVCAAGNDATTRPRMPAALAAQRPASGVVPLVGVGALNPNGTDALFSNAGPWVTTHRPGVLVFSTMPTLDTSRQASVELTHDGRTRASLDPDDFTSGFGLWSGTSFAAPVLAGQVAQELLGRLPARPEPVKTTRARARRALARALETPTG